MHTGGGVEESEKVGKNLELSAAQALLWWSGVGKHPLQAASSSPVKSLPVEHSGTVTAAAVPLGFGHPLQSTTPLLAQSVEEGHVSQLLAARMPPVPASGYDGGTGDEQCQQSASLSVISQFPGEYILPHTQLELGHSMVQAAYPYAGPYFGGMIAAYGAQAMMLGVQQARMPLPSEVTEEEPVYVNAKQYHAIMRRRQSRAKAESENKLIRARKPYLHESRHLHAMKRARGCGGRFLNTKNKDESKSKSDGNVSSEGQSSQEGTSCESRETHLESNATGSLNQNIETIQGIPTHLMASMGQSCVNGAAYHPGMLSSGGHSVISLSTGQAGYSNHSNQRFHSSVFRPCPGGGNEGGSGQSRGIMSNGSQQRAVAIQ